MTCFGRAGCASSRPQGSPATTPTAILEPPVGQAPAARAIEQLSENLIRKDLSPIEEGEALKAVLEANGSSLDRVANCEVMLADIKERDAFNEVYSKFWEQGQFPARHAFGVTGLYLGARVEIACVAIAAA